MKKELLLQLAVFLLGVCFLVPGAMASNPVDFQLPDIDGNERTLSEFRGKWVVVNYWATWCPPCLEEMPELELFHSEHKDTNAVVLGVNFEDISKKRLKAFLDDQLISFPILLAEPTFRTELGRITGLPTSYLITPEGKVAARQVGPVSKATLERYIENYKKK